MTGTTCAPVPTVAPDWRLAPAHAGGPWPAGALVAPEPLAAVLDEFVELDLGPWPDPAHGGGPWPECVLVAPKWFPAVVVTLEVCFSVAVAAGG